MSYNQLGSQHQHPYGSTDPVYSESTGYIAPMPPPKKGVSKWIKFGIPVGIIIVIAAVVGGVLGAKASNDDDSSSSGSSTNGGNPDAAASSAVSAKGERGVFPTATNSYYMVPLYPTETDTSAYVSPTFVPTSDSTTSWPKDPQNFANPNVQTVRSDRPRLIAPAYKWDALPDLIKNDPYMAHWNETIFNNASAIHDLGPVAYVMDGDSGILDNAREIKQRIKILSYVYRMTKDTKWADRAWLEIANAAGNGTNSFGPDDTTKWNPTHFLDTAEFSAAFAIAYDWLYDILSDEEKSQLIFSLNKYGLDLGVNALVEANGTTGWWANDVTGNWNCVCNDGLTMGSLAILGDDTSGNAEKLLGATVDNALKNCAQAVSTDGTWAETPNYWYFGTTGHAEMSSSLISATGSDYKLTTTNPDFEKTGEFHMYVYGPQEMFNFGDHGPNKFSATANSIIYYATTYQRPEYALFQRDRADAADPFNMFWYDPTLAGAYWNGLALDKNFDNGLDQWVSMRSSWTDPEAMFVAMKAGLNQGHQTHNDLDVGTFVIQGGGYTWAGELGSGDYRSPQYFQSEAQDAERWKYYRKMTEGQNTILVNRQNQLVTAKPTIEKFETTGTKQDASTVLEIADDDTAYWITDMTSAFNDVTSSKRGVRFLNGRKQVLVQDEITTSQTFQWRMHTNATWEAGSNKATLELYGQKMDVQIISPAEGASFTKTDAVRFDTDPTPLIEDQANPGVSVMIIELPAGEYNLQVLFSPQWSDKNVTPPSVNLADWSLTSHNA